MGELDKIKFEGILSSRTTFGLIWKGTYRDSEATLNKCVIKMVILTSGITYNSETEEYFQENEEAPFYHKNFKRFEPVSKDYYYNEVKGLQRLYSKGIAPEMYSFFMVEKNGIHYGFIVMKRMHCSLRDILIRRDLSPEEKKIVTDLIDKMHSYKLTHGDLKPGNIGVSLNLKGDLVKCKIFDCQNVRDNTKMEANTREQSKFKERIKRDWDTYKKHYIENRSLSEVKT